METLTLTLDGGDQGSAPVGKSISDLIGSDDTQFVESRENRVRVCNKEEYASGHAGGGGGGGGGGSDGEGGVADSEEKVGCDGDAEGSVEKENGIGMNLGSDEERDRNPKNDGQNQGDMGLNMSMDAKEGDPDEKVADKLRNRVVSSKKKENKDVNVQDDGSEREDEDGHGTEFSVGDFVWGKIKSYPWWPGMIFDPSSATDFALRYKHEDRLLVAYFGDGTFAWCKSSQLKPFTENFENMSKQSTMKSFLNAVNDSVDVFSRLVEMEMTCPCIPKENQLVAPLISNAGIVKDTALPLSGLGRFSVAQVEPAAIVADIKCMASSVSFTNVLKLAALKSQLAAFYRAGGNYGLPKYYEPLGIEDLEHVKENPDVGMQNEPTTKQETNSGKLGSKKTRKTSNGVEDQGRGDQSKVKQGKKMKEGTQSGRKRNKTAEADWYPEDESEGKEVDNKKEGLSSRKLALKSGGKRRKVDEDQGFEDDKLINLLGRRKKERLGRSAIAANKKSSKSENGIGAKKLRVASSSRQSGTEALVFSNIARFGERMMKAAGNLIGSPPVVKCGGETTQKKSSKELGPKKV